jgi:hypothetical protein
MASRCVGRTIKRKSHSRKSYTRKNGVHVKRAHVGAVCIKNQGEAGKWTSRHKTRGIGPLKPGKLKAFGYSSKKSTEERHAAIKRAIKAYGALAVYRMLQAVATYSKRTTPGKSHIYMADRNYVGKLVGYKH